MDLRHFAFTRYPFENTLEAEERYASHARREAEARLKHLIELRGIGLMTGEVGSGKTTVCRYVTAGLHPGQYRVYYVSLSTGNMLDMRKGVIWELACPRSDPAPPPTAPSAMKSPAWCRRPSSCRC